MARTPQEKLLSLAGRQGIIRASDAKAFGLRRETIARLAAKGLLARVGRGMYALPGGSRSVQHSLAAVAVAAPSAVICLLSALRFHGLTTQSPSVVWIALPNKARRPAAATAMEIVYLSGKSLTAGVERHRIEGIEVPIYGAAKTVADCFKFRNRIGVDVAVEALRDFLRKHRGGADEVWRYAKINRVTRVMQPYLEAVG